MFTQVYKLYFTMSLNNPHIGQQPVGLTVTVDSYVIVLIRQWQKTNNWVLIVRLKLQ